MPNIGGKKFPYTPAGKRAAGRYAKATGQPMGNSGGYGGIRRPARVSNLRRPMAPKRRSMINPLAMLGMLRRRNRV